MKINPREKLLIIAGGMILFFIMYYLFAVDMALVQRKKLNRGIAEKKAEIIEMQSLKTKWAEIEASRQDAKSLLSRRPKEFTLLSFLERISRETNIQDKIRYMKPLTQTEENKPATQLEGIETEIEGIDIKDLVNFLYQIEYSGNLLSIKRIKIQRSSKTQLLKVTLQINTYIST
jgi:type II secretory pathway component PulM